MSREWVGGNPGLTLHTIASAGVCLWHLSLMCPVPIPYVARTHCKMGTQTSHFWGPASHLNVDAPMCSAQESGSFSRCWQGCQTHSDSSTTAAVLSIFPCCHVVTQKTSSLRVLLELLTSTCVLKIVKSARAELRKSDMAYGGCRLRMWLAQCVRCRRTAPWWGIWRRTCNG